MMDADIADYILDDITDFYQVKSPEWIANQPFGQMPYLEDPEEGLVIFESRAISRCTCAPSLTAMTTGH